MPYMEPNIHDFIRLTLKAKHMSTGTVVSFPLIHILVEEAEAVFVATCLEYSQAYDAASPSEAVAGLITVMYRYFFSVLKKEGREALFIQARNGENNHLWDSIREYSARKLDKHLAFVEMSFKGSDLREASESLKKDVSILTGIDAEHVRYQQEIITQQRNLIDQIKKELIEKAEALKKLSVENKQLKYGLEGGQEWEEQIEESEISRSNLLPQP